MIKYYILTTLVSFVFMSCSCQEYNVYYNDSTIVNLISTDSDTIITLKGMYAEDIIDPPDGLWTVYYDVDLNHKAYQINIIKGRIKGIKTEWYRNGNKKLSGKYNDWLCIQDCTRYFQSGEIEYQRQHISENDLEKWFYESGEIKLTKLYVENIPIKSVEYFKSGQVKREYYYKPSTTYIEGYEPFLGVEFDTLGTLIGSLKFNQRIYMDGYSEIVERTIVIDTLKKNE